MRYFNLVIFLILVATKSFFSQGEYNTWYFGNKAGMSFNAGSPVDLNNSNIFVDEGTAVASDKNGNLLFYTQMVSIGGGMMLLDKTHNPMPNGSGLLGHSSTTQGALIVPSPGNKNHYYVFMIEQAGQPTGLSYSKVDMTLNGGMGDVVVTEKNIILHTSSTERMIGVRHCNGKDFWVVIHERNSNRFAAFLVNSSGVSSSPVFSSIGASHDESTSYPYSIAYTQGQMQATKDGKRIVCPRTYVAGDYTDDKVQLFCFDNCTGSLSNLVSFNHKQTYGYCFSPDGTKLYLACTIGGLTGEISQYDLNAGNIQASKKVVGTSSVALGQLQLAPDGKIYVVKQLENTLGCINLPNVAGVGCNYVNNGFTLSGTNLMGLPNIIHNFYDTIPKSGNSVIINPVGVFCVAGPAAQLTAIPSGGSWSGAGIINASTGMFNPQIAGVGKHVITYSYAGGFCAPSSSDTMHITVSASGNVKISQVPVLCDGDSLYQLLATPGGGKWKGAGIIDSVSGKFDPSQVGQGMHKVYYSTSGSCPANDSVTITVASVILPVLSSAGPYCVNDTAIQITATPAGGTWQGAGVSPVGVFNPSIAGAGTHTIVYYFSGACASADSTTITVSANLSPLISAAGPFCKGSNNVQLFASPTGGSWSGNGVTVNGIFDLSFSGNFKVWYSIPGNCGGIDSMNIMVNPTPLANAGSDQNVSSGSVVQLSALPSGLNYSWSPSSGLSCSSCAFPTFIAENTTTYKLTTIDSLGCTANDYITVFVTDSCKSIFIPNAFSPNGDGNNDIWLIRGNCIDKVFIQVFDRWGNLVFESRSIKDGWRGGYKTALAETAVYYYRINLLFGSGEEKEFSGEVYLIK